MIRDLVPALKSEVLYQQMDILKVLAALRQEREQIEDAIVVIERLAMGRGKRRGPSPRLDGSN